MTGSAQPPDQESSSSPVSGKDTPSLAARRARLRGTLAGRSDTEMPPEGLPEAGVSPLESVVRRTTTVSQPDLTVQPRTVFTPMPPTSDRSNGNTVLLGSIDRALSVCASNLADLQKIAGQQSEALKVLTVKLQDKGRGDIGLSLSALTESFSAALEPMKEVSRIKPAIEQLSAVVNENMHRQDKISSDELVANLAGQLADGAIDSQVFCSAYTAIFPAKSVQELLKSLVQLLGTQRLSGDRFRAAYDAIQSEGAHSNNGEEAALLNTEMQTRFEVLQSANQVLQDALKAKEEEMSQQLSDKEGRLQKLQDQMAQRFEELTSKYAEVNGQLAQRTEKHRVELQSKDSEISDKESELSMLRRQMEELKSQTQDMVRSLQQQMTVAQSKQVRVSGGSDSAAPSAKVTASSDNFFESPAAGHPGSFYGEDSTAVKAAAPRLPGNAGASRQEATHEVANNEPMRTTSAAVAGAASSYPIASGQGIGQRTSNSAGRHGTGVRAQVFEVIVRQALAGAPWREMCAGPMQVNNITPEEVEAEVKRRQANK